MDKSIIPQNCGDACKEPAVFSLKFIIESLSLSSEQGEKGLNGVLLLITFDGNIIKFDNFQEDEDSKFKVVGREFEMLISPEQLSEKLRRCPILFNLSRGYDELATFKLEIAGCFADVIKCEEFSSETNQATMKLIQDSEENGEMTVIFQVSRPVEVQTFRSKLPDKKITSKSLKKTSEGKKKSKGNEGGANKNREMVIEDREEDDKDDNQSDHSQNLEDRSNVSSKMSSGNDTELSPIEEESDVGIESTMSSLRTSSLKSKSIRSKCFSDIATSLKLCDYPDNLKTYCNGCAGFSISGVTCDNKEILKQIQSVPVENASTPQVPVCKDSSQVTVIPNEKCKSIRCCSECFKDLSVLAEDVPCPNFIARKQLQRKPVSFRRKKTQLKEKRAIKGCFKSVLDGIVNNMQGQLRNDWKRLKGQGKTKSGKKLVIKKDIHKKTPCIGGSSSGAKPLKHRRKCPRKCRKSQYVSRGNMPPVLNVSHQLCQGDGPLVPKNMGWLWNVPIPGVPCIRPGWRPGSVKKSVAKIMKISLTPPAEPAPPIWHQEVSPTLRVLKKNGEYKIVMNPLADDGLKSMITSPIVFKITKSEEAKKRSLARQILKSRGITKKCDCSSIDTCFCLNQCEKNRFKCEMEKVSEKLCLKSVISLSDLNDSSDSEVDMEFTPPAAANKKNPHVKCKPPRVTAVETQYETQAVTLPAAKFDNEGKLMKDLKDHKELKGISEVNGAKMGLKGQKKVDGVISGKTNQKKSVLLKTGVEGMKASKSPANAFGREVSKKTFETLKFSAKLDKKHGFIPRGVRPKMPVSPGVLRDIPSKKGCEPKCVPKCNDICPIPRDCFVPDCGSTYVQCQPQGFASYYGLCQPNYCT